MGKKKKKRVTKDNFYRPKKYINAEGEPSVRCYKRFINNFVDPHDWGNDKKHFHYYYNNRMHKAKKSMINASLISGVRNSWGKYRMPEYLVGKHLTTNKKIEYLYYTNSPLSHTPLFCIDIDPLDYTAEHDLLSVASFLLELHPGSYWEYSTSGKGIHFYLLLDLSNYNKIDTSFWNKVMSGYSDLLKLYINSYFNVKFDAVKATYCSYSYDVRFERFVMSKCGTLCKLPRPTTIDGFKRLYNISFVSIDTINSNANQLCSSINSLVNIALFNPMELVTGTSFPSIIFPLSNNCSSFSPITGGTALLRGKEWLAPFFPHTSFNCYYLIDWLYKGLENCLSPFSIPLTTIPNSMFTDPVSNTSLDSKILSNDVIIRSFAVCRLYYRNYYKEYKRVPGFDEFRQYYRQTAGTGSETEKNRERLEYVYDEVYRTFDPKKLSLLIYTIGQFLPDINKLNISQGYINLWIKSKYPKSKNKIQISDLDVALGYYYTNLMKDKKDRASKSRSFCVGIAGLVKWFRKLRDNKQYHRSCNGTQAQMSRDLLIDIGLLNMFDSSYITAKSASDDIGRSQRFVITEKCSYYHLFENYYSKEIIESFVIETKEERNSA